jgi:Cytochrome c7 and related cytochrome c
LRNAHGAAKVKCADCHKDAKSYRNVPLTCIGCHRKDDKHEGQLGERCESCHGDRDWKSTGFDHGRTRFALVGRHIAVACNKCHETPRYKDARSECSACHLKDDKHKLRFGTGCEACHNARAWGIWDYDHARRARYPLDGAHRKIDCEACHTRPAPAGKAIAEVGRSCVACHQKSDVHEGSFGPRCEQCHGTDSWRRLRNRLFSRTGTGVTPTAWALGQSSRFAAIPRRPTS